MPVSGPTNAGGFDGLHFDFSPGGAATTLLLAGARMRNPENSPFVFDSALPRPGVETAERGGEKAKAKMDSGFRRNDEQNRTTSLRQVAACPYRLNGSIEFLRLGVQVRDDILEIVGVVMVGPQVGVFGG